MNKSNKSLSSIIYCSFVIQLFLVCNTCIAKSDHSKRGWVLNAVTAASNSLNDIERVYPDGGDAVIKGIMELGDAHMDALQYDKAENIYLRAVESHKSAFKDVSGDFRHDLVLHVKLLSLLADSEMKQGDFDSATHNYRRGLHAAKLGMGATTPEVKHLRTGLVLAIARRSTKQASESLFEQLLAASERASGFISDDIAMILENWIEFRGYTGRLAECEDMSIRLVDVLQRVHGSDHPEVAEALNRQASIIYKISQDKRSERGKDALPLLRKASQIRHAAFGAEHPLSKLSEKNLETLLRELYLKNKI